MESIVEGMARIMWGDAWASAAEEAGVSLSGMKIEEVMPPVPAVAMQEARNLAAGIEKANGVSLSVLLDRAAAADVAEGRSPGDDPLYAERFGECLAFQAIGAGVSWFDGHADFPVEIPSFEPVMTMGEALTAVENDQAARRPR